MGLTPADRGCSQPSKRCQSAVTSNIYTLRRFASVLTHAGAFRDIDLAAIPSERDFEFTSSCPLTVLRGLIEYIFERLQPFGLR